MNPSTRFQFLNEAVCISCCANTLGKSINPTIPAFAMVTILTKHTYIYTHTHTHIYIYIYILTSTILLKRLIMHLSDTCSLAQHLKNVHAQQLNFGEFLPKTQYLNNKITRKNYRFSRHYILRIYNPKLNRINFETSANVLKCLLQLTLFIETNSKGKRYTMQLYKRSFLQSSNVRTKVTSLL